MFKDGHWLLLLVLLRHFHCPIPRPSLPSVSSSPTFWPSSLSSPSCYPIIFTIIPYSRRWWYFAIVIMILLQGLVLLCLQLTSASAPLSLFGDHHNIALFWLWWWGWGLWLDLASCFSCKGSSYLFTEYKYPVDPGAGQRNRAEYARQYGPVMPWHLWKICDRDKM